MGTLRWYRHDQEVVTRQLRGGTVLEMVAPTGTGALDALIALHDEVGALAAVEALETQRCRAGLPEGVLLRSLTVLPFLGGGGFRPLADALLREAGLLLRLGWSPVQLREGANTQHRHPAGRQEESLPCHPDTLRDALARVTARAWMTAQQTAVARLYQQRLVRGRVYAVDGTGLGATRRVVALVCVSGDHPVVVAWRYLEGAASEKGKEAAVTRGLIEQVLAAGGDGSIALLLADALYADGPLLAWLQYRHGIDALVRLPADRLLYEDAQGLAAGGRLTWVAHRYVRTRQGRKQRRAVALAGVGELDSWPSFREAAARYGAAHATLWVCLLREMAPLPEAGRRRPRPGEHARVADPRRRVPGLPPPLGDRGRHVSRTQGGLGAGAVPVGNPSRDRAWARHAHAAGLQSPDQSRTLRHLAGGHRHPRHGLSGSPTLHQHARVPRQSGQPDFN